MRGHAFSCSWEISAPEKAPVWDDIVCYNDERLLRTPLLPIWGATVCDLLRLSWDRAVEQYQKAHLSVLGTRTACCANTSTPRGARAIAP